MNNLNNNESKNPNTINQILSNKIDFNENINEKNQKFSNKKLNNKNTNFKKILIIILIILLIGCASFGVTYLLLNNNSNSNFQNEENNNNAKEEISGTTKTLMIYMCGSDLESENCLGTINLSHLMESDIDFDNINIVLCAGGTQRWYNSEISEKETSIYNINKKGITKEKKQSKQDMADGNTITNFIDYVYENYETDEYYFMFWNHGMALDGLEYDELSGNILSLAELDECLANTKLNEDNKKFEMIILNNCLMGSLETANILSNYANYLTASEDVMYGAEDINTFGFLDGIEKNDSAVDIGKSYIDCYTKSVKKNYKNSYITFSLIDLNKIDEVIDNIDSYFSEIQLDAESFKKIAKIRNSVYEYQPGQDYLDMVDLHQLINKFENVNSNNEDLIKSIEEAVVYNSTTDPYSKGISIYFPETADWTKVYDTIEFSETYKDFVKEYIAIYTGKKTISFSVNNKEVNKLTNGFSIQLSEEEKTIYKDSEFHILEDNNDGTYTSVFKSSDTNIDGNGLITANINNKMISVTDNSDGNEFVLGNLIELDKTNEYIMYGLPVVLEGYDEENNLSMTAALMKLKLNKDGTIEMLETHDWVKSEDGKVSTNGAIIDLKSTDKYQTIYFLKSTRTVETDENGNYVKLGDLKASYGITMSSNADFIFKNVDLEQGKKYVGVFCVKDVYNDEYYSKLIDIK